MVVNSVLFAFLVFLRMPAVYTTHCPTWECIVYFDDIQLIQKKLKELQLDFNVKCQFVIMMNHIKG